MLSKFNKIVVVLLTLGGIERRNKVKAKAIACPLKESDALAATEFAQRAGHRVG